MAVKMHRVIVVEDLLLIKAPLLSKQERFLQSGIS